LIGIASKKNPIDMKKSEKSYHFFFSISKSQGENKIRKNTCENHTEKNIIIFSPRERRKKQSGPHSP